MKEYVLDANALVRLFRNEPGADRIEQLLIQADKGQTTLHISMVNLAEVLYVASRYFPIEEVRRNIEKIHELVEFAVPDERQSLFAGELRHHYKLGLADCFAAALAIEKSATLVTADAEFKKLGRKLKVLALPQHQRCLE